LVLKLQISGSIALKASASTHVTVGQNNPAAGATRTITLGMESPRAKCKANCLHGIVMPIWPETIPTLIVGIGKLLAQRFSIGLNERL
jgi:hypothetical protein